jgi:hypothetical protein
MIVSLKEGETGLKNGSLLLLACLHPETANTNNMENEISDLCTKDLAAKAIILAMKLDEYFLA